MVIGTPHVAPLGRGADGAARHPYLVHGSNARIHFVEASHEPERRTPIRPGLNSVSEPIRRSALHPRFMAGEQVRKDQRASHGPVGTSRREVPARVRAGGSEETCGT